MSVFLAMCTHSSVGEQLLTLAFSASLCRTREQTPLARFGDLLVCLVFSSFFPDFCLEQGICSVRTGLVSQHIFSTPRATIVLN